ncbi:MAG: hypothetical protein ACYSTG_03645, partial [Planctomycetota bacterium]
MSRLVTASVMPFLLLLVAPLTFYFGNVDEVNFPLSDVVLAVLVSFIGVCVVIYLLLSVLTNYPRLYQILSGLLVGMAAAIWVQSQLLVWDFGPLDGRGTDWNRWSSHMWLEGAAWVVIILGFMYLFARKHKSASRILLPLVFAIGAISIVSSYIMIIVQTTKQDHERQEYFNAMFSFHPKNNTIIILLDTFQSDYFDFIRTNYLEETEFLDGFIFYRNTISNFPTTKPSIPAIRTGATYRNEKDLISFVNDAYGSYDILETYKDRGYLSHVSSDGGMR